MKGLAPLSRDHLVALLGHLPDPAFILTSSGRYSAMFGGTDLRYYHDGSSLVGRSLHDVLTQAKADWFVEVIGKALVTRSLHVVEYGLAGSDVKGLPAEGPQHTIWFEGRVQALDFLVEGESAVLWVASNITARKELELQLRTLGETDPLTGLYNRRKLMEHLGELHGVFARYGTPTSVLVFDLDEFKRINDQYGHLVGDRAIVAVAEVCRAELRATDVAARFGGDEFVVLMSHTAIADATIIAQRLGIKVTEKLRGMGKFGDDVTISGGLSQFAHPDTSGEDVLRRADDALYRAKREGRRRMLCN